MQCFCVDNFTGLSDESNWSLDVFIYPTDDPYKEPPIGVESTALSAMAYDYPPIEVSYNIS